MTTQNPSSVTQANYARYAELLHAMQSGVAFTMPSGETEPKHLRVGVNAAMCDHAALIRLLTAKGLITEEEYSGELVAEMEREVERYRQRLGPNVSLA